MAKNFGDYLYNKLPQFYRYEDAKLEPKYPLKRFLNILGAGLDSQYATIEEYLNKFDLDTCNPAFLPRISKLLGFEFPYNATIQEQRKFLKNIVTLYKLKGTDLSFKFIAQQVFGNDTTIDIYLQDSPYPDKPHLLYIKVKVTANGEYLDITEKEENFKRWIEDFRPANMGIGYDYNLFYSDDFNLYDKASIYEERFIINETPILEIRTNPNLSFYLTDILKAQDSDYYKVSDILKYENEFLLNSEKLNDRSSILSTPFLGIERLEPTDEDLYFELNKNETGSNTGILIVLPQDKIIFTPDTEISIFKGNDAGVEEITISELETQNYTNTINYNINTSTRITRQASTLVGSSVLNNFYLTSITQEIAVNY